MARLIHVCVALGVGLGAMGCAVEAPPTAGADLAPALESVTTDDLMRHIEILASDGFEGRAPGSKGEELTVTHLTEQFESLGLEPGNPDGSYTQAVSLVGITGKPSASIVTSAGPMTLAFPTDYVAVSRRVVPEITVEDSDVVFVGYGVVAPEYDWDDYKDVDVTGKTIVMLVNDPAVPDPSDPSTLDASMFKGRAMTYYGRWTYKYEIASQKGAAAAIIVHETGPAGYPYEVVSGSWGGEGFDLATPDNNQDRLPVEAWIHLDRARELFQAAGLDFDEMKRAAVRADFKPVPLDATATFTISNTVREIDSTNVIAKLDGSDPDLRDEYVIYTAHWDHLGRDPGLEGDQIYNGAVDNASGTAALLELAEAFTMLQRAPKRSILFLAVTAEEQGLLGAKHYVTNPLYPLEKTLASINIDGLNQWGATRDLVLIGYGNSTLDDVTERLAEARGRTVRPDQEPEKGFFYRSDHFEFAKQGVPALDPDSGVEYIGKPADYGQEKRSEYTARDYHKPSDEVRSDWDLQGAVDDVRCCSRSATTLPRATAGPSGSRGPSSRRSGKRCFAEPNWILRLRTISP